MLSHFDVPCCCRAQLLLGLGSKPQDVTKIYFVCSMGFGFLMMLALGVAIWHLAMRQYV